MRSQIRGKEIVVGARRAHGATGRNVQGDEKSIVQTIHHSGAIVEGGVLIAFAREQDAYALGFESDASRPGKVQNHIAFGKSGRTARAEIGAAMRRVEDYRKVGKFLGGRR